MDKQQQRALYGPGWVEVILGVGLSLLVGVILGAIWLVFKPVVVAKELSTTAAPGSVFYYPGATNANAARTWMRKKQILAEGQAGEFVLTEEELNAWAADTMKSSAPDATSTVAPSQINFRIADGILQIATPVSVDLLGLSLPVIIQARGDFEKQDDVFTFVPREMYLGSLATHRIPGLAERTLRYITQVHPFPQDVTDGWKKLAAVSVEGKQLRLTLP